MIYWYVIVIFLGHILQVFKQTTGDRIVCDCDISWSYTLGFRRFIAQNSSYRLVYNLRLWYFLAILWGFGRFIDQTTACGHGYLPFYGMVIRSCVLDVGEIYLQDFERFYLLKIHAVKRSSHLVPWYGVFKMNSKI